ncbi:CTP synthase [Eubacteriales bacterium OttesenSCG-928-A19]|nr:CTP synthase [Eubacteriales bacterium OttesenSCG-928-A19]
MTKYIFVTGGVVSGLGKGITAASLGRLLKARGLRVTAQKFDPYMNVDPGTLSPFQHGEVFVTEDGAETDLDLGHYERFIDEDLTKFSNLTSGKVYWSVLHKEREGRYLGETVQIIPHVTNEIKSFIRAAAKASKADVLITEIGGTIGDIESQPFLEAIRQLAKDVGRNNCLFVHVTLVPFLSASGEHKSKPTQHSVKELRALGINPDIIVARVEEPMEDDLRRKISLFCDVNQDCVIENQTVSCLYEAPLMMHQEGLDRVACRALRLKTPEPDLASWTEMVQRIRTAHKSVRIAIVGKYIRLHDAYLSIAEALSHAGFTCGASVEILWVESAEVTDENAAEMLSGCNGVLVPGGFGDRGIEGMISACRYARENHIPYFGICLGMQISVIEFARNVCGIQNANSREFARARKNLVIDFMPDQNNNIPKGGTMRLGAYPCQVKPNTALHRAYKQDLVHERHRHRYEFNNRFRDQLEACGLSVSGTSPNGHIVEATELQEEDFFVGVQFHPEFKSRPNRAHPLFVGFVSAAMRRQDGEA